jgi:hypothetical protein
MHESKLFHSLSFFRALIALTHYKSCVSSRKITIDLMFSPNFRDQITKTGIITCKITMQTKALDHLIRI